MADARPSPSPVPRFENNHFLRLHPTLIMEIFETIRQKEIKKLCLCNLSLSSHAFIVLFSVQYAHLMVTVSLTRTYLSTIQSKDSFPTR